MHGVNGLLASSHDEWVEALDQLADDAALRSRLGARARRDVLLQLSPHRQGRRYLALLEQAVARRSSPRVSDWVPVAPESPPRFVQLDAYGAEPVAGQTVADRLRARRGDFAERLHRARAAGGAAEVTRAAGRVLRRRLLRR
ncbi:MAG: glycosyltransferase, partial [Frankiales bacterium]|nr:glycosyltransferase [Frankiales bacterium]